MSFEEYNPPSTLVVPEHEISKAKYPFIDVHSHQYRMPDQDLKALTAEMDKINMGIMVNLSGRGFKRTESGGFGVNDNSYLKRAIENSNTNASGRVVVFTNISFSGIGEKDWTKKAVKELEEDVQVGAKGLKIYKSLGFSVKDTEGNRVSVDDTRLDPIWAKCGELGIPVLIHAADPKPFWDEQDANNERWLELKIHPRRKRSNTDPVPWQQIIDEQHAVFQKHPGTIFINAHMGWYANDLAKLGELLDEMPNMYVEIGAVIAELGRQPRMANLFFNKYQDRVLFGKDSWKPEEYPTYFRVLESNDEYFPYYKKYHAYWKMYGLNLPDEILKKLYYKNALNIIPNLDASLFPK
ncbi:MAG: amidohydrolase [Cyclobacteriaceae bacterium]|nr:amidohydrolase [Cyclobacteriaceae bacterium]